MPVGQSLAASIRQFFTRERREQAIEFIGGLITAPGIDPAVRLRAFDLLARYGWPEEKSGAIGLRISGKHAQVLVQHVHTPIGLPGAPDVVGAPGGSGVRLETAEVAPEPVALLPTVAHESESADNPENTEG